jgi:hypothetical protein
MKDMGFNFLFSYLGFDFLFIYLGSDCLFSYLGFDFLVNYLLSKKYFTLYKCCSCETNSGIATGKGIGVLKIIPMDGKTDIPLTHKLLDMLHIAFDCHLKYKIICHKIHKTVNALSRE